jgi:lipopolysaccharide cholinephosphotransferase
MNQVTVMEMLPEDVRKMQLMQLDILKEFDRICRKYGIKYTLCGGSMLGAVRHKGFIPWDDDIDVTVLREDYNKFSELCKTELDPDKYFYQSMETDSNYHLMYNRILLKGTAYIRAGQEHLKARTGIFVDIFPRDNRSDIRIISRLQSKLAYLMRKTLHSPVGKYRSAKASARFFYAILSTLPQSFPKKLMRLIIKLGGKKPTERVACYGLMGDNEKRKLLLGKKGYEDTEKKSAWKAKRSSLRAGIETRDYTGNILRKSMICSLKICR